WTATAVEPLTRWLPTPPFRPWGTPSRSIAPSPPVRGSTTLTASNAVRTELSVISTARPADAAVHASIMWPAAAVVQSPILSFAYIGHSVTGCVRSSDSGGGGSFVRSTYRGRRRVRTSVRTGRLPGFPIARAGRVIHGLPVVSSGQVFRRDRRCRATVFRRPSIIGQAASALLAPIRTRTDLVLPNALPPKQVIPADLECLELAL